DVEAAAKLASGRGIRGRRGDRHRVGHSARLADLPAAGHIALHVLDETWKTTGQLGVLVRYADDLVVVCATRDRAEEAERRVTAALAPLGLQLHPDKTKIV